MSQQFQLFIFRSKTLEHEPQGHGSKTTKNRITAGPRKGKEQFAEEDLNESLTRWNVGP